MLSTNNSEIWGNCQSCFGSIYMDYQAGSAKTEKWLFDNQTQVTHDPGSAKDPSCHMFGDLCAPKNTYVALNNEVQDDRGTWGLFFDVSNYTGTEIIEITIYVSDHVWSPFWLAFQMTAGLLITLTFYKEFWQRLPAPAVVKKEV